MEPRGQAVTRRAEHKRHKPIALSRAAATTTTVVGSFLVVGLVGGAEDHTHSYLQTIFPDQDLQKEREKRRKGRKRKGKGRKGKEREGKG